MNTIDILFFAKNNSPSFYYFFSAEGLHGASGVKGSTSGWSKEFKNIIEENFPLDRLKAMIDK